jgi:hypothetical protein
MLRFVQQWRSQGTGDMHTRAIALVLCMRDVCIRVETGSCIRVETGPGYSVKITRNLPSARCA